MYSMGRKNKAIMTPDGTTININYGFISLLFIFNFTYGYKWSLAAKADDGTVNYKALTKEEATQLNGNKTPYPPVLERFSFIIIVILAVVAGLVRFITNL